MPLAAAIPAVISAVPSIYSASQQSKAASKANKAQQAAAAQQSAVQQANLDRIVNLNQPMVQGGSAAFDQILQRLGVTGAGPRPASSQASYGGAGKTPGGSAGTSPLEGASTAAGGPDWNAYAQANPDVAAQAAKEGRDPAEYAQAHYTAYGQQEGRALPTQAAQPTTPDQPAPAVDPNAAPDLMNAQRPDAPQAPQYQRPTAINAPGDFRYTPADIENDVGYQFARDQSLDGVNAAFTARGKLRSGDAAKALQDRAAGVAHQFDNNFFNRALQTYGVNTDAYRYAQGRQDNVFADDRAYDTSKWQFDTQRQDQNFNVDRGYQTNRWDTQTGNLFNVAGMGQQAVGQIAGAGTNNATAQSNIFGSQANAAADAAYMKGSANAQLGSSLGSVAGNLFANWGGGSAARVTPGMMQTPWTAGSSSNPFVNTPSSVRPVF